jgi:hypothetical protein
MLKVTYTSLRLFHSLRGSLHPRIFFWVQRKTSRVDRAVESLEGQYESAAAFRGESGHGVVHISSRFALRMERHIILRIHRDD